MSSLDKNKIFFGLMHYILSEQHNVDWMLKTSLVNFTGINSTVDNKQFQQTSLTNDIIDYIYQIKPYHTQFEQFIEKYSSDQDEVKVSSQEHMDFEIQVRFDAVTSEVDEQGDMSDEEYMNTHMANRLWYYKHADLKEIYKDDEHIKDYIKDVLNCHFKGITVDGYQFDIDKHGYDVFLYDETLYDAPTVTVDYCLLDYTEEGLKCPYEKPFVKVGVDSLLLPNRIEDAQVEVKMKRKNSDEYKIVDEYSIKDNILTLFDKMNYLDKVIVTVTSNVGQYAYVFSSHYFTESTEGSDTRKIATVGTTTFPIPFDDTINAGKLVVYIETESGSRYPTTNFTKIGNDIIINDGSLRENCHVIITNIDTKHLYDKIYTYEDCYGQSNNLITLDGNDFLRPFYEKERPSELCVSYPYNNLMIYETLDNDVYQSLRNVDHKDVHYQMALNPSLTTVLTETLEVRGYKTNEPKDTDGLNNQFKNKEIIVEDISKLILPKKTETGKTIPGKILLNAEVIEFYDYEEKEDGSGVLKSIRRATAGSYLNKKHDKGSIVYAINDNAKNDISSQAVHTKIVINDVNDKEYKILGSTFEPANIEIISKSFITLLSDVTKDGTYFDISDDNVQFPGNVTLISDNEYSTVYANQMIGINIGGDDYQIKITKDYPTLDSFIGLISQKIPQTVGLTISNNLDKDDKKTNHIKIVAPNGRYIKLYNVKGEPVQQLFGIRTTGTIKNPSVQMDGYNGLLINGYKVIWGNDKYSLTYLQNKEPEMINIDDVVASINGVDFVKTIVKAYNRNGVLEIVPLINEPIIFDTLTNPNDVKDNVQMLGIQNIDIPTYVVQDKQGYGCYTADVDTMGVVYLNGDKVLFKNIEKIVNDDGVVYRISNYISSKEYKANNTIINEYKFNTLSKDLYKINIHKNGEDVFGTITFNKSLKKGDLYIVSNVK